MKDLNKTWFGIVIGLLVPAVVYSIYYFIISHYPIKQINISLCMVTNLIPFYIFLNRQNNNAAKGVLIATIVYAAVIGFLGIFTNVLKFL